MVYEWITVFQVSCHQQAKCGLEKITIQAAVTISGLKLAARLIRHAECGPADRPAVKIHVRVTAGI